MPCFALTNCRRSVAKGTRLNLLSIAPPSHMTRPTTQAPSPQPKKRLFKPNSGLFFPLHPTLTLITTPSPHRRADTTATPPSFSAAVLLLDSTQGRSTTRKIAVIFAQHVNVLLEYSHIRARYLLPSFPSSSRLLQYPQGAFLWGP